MKIIVIGAGAMGSLYGGYLTKGKENVCFLHFANKTLIKYALIYRQ